MNRKGYAVLAALVILLSASNIEASPIARLTLVSQPGDFIGGGGNFDITYPQGQDPIVVGLAAYVQGLPGNVLFLLDASEGMAWVNVATFQLGFPLRPGIYLDAQRDPLEAPGHPGLAISFRGLGCDTITGNFTITDATFSNSNTLSSFAVSFEQHCEGATPALFGTFTYNANATEVPEPAAYWLVGVGMVCLSFIRLQRRS